jgi:hypothetical protein
MDCSNLKAESRSQPGVVLVWKICRLAAGCRPLVTGFDSAELVAGWLLATGVKNNEFASK